jgi:electron transfer flavoprotein beta subunit
MDIITCYKIVPDAQDLVVLADQTLSLAKAELQIGQYDLNAVEAGMQIIEIVGGKVIALSAGGNNVDNSKLKKSILSRGPHELFLVKEESLENADTHWTASVLAAAVKKIGTYDLVLCGEGSSDLYAQQVGIQLGEILGLPTVNSVSRIIPQGDKIMVERTLENEIEVLEIPLPAVICVTTDINITRIPSMKDILGAAKKPSTLWTLADLDLAEAEIYNETISTLAPKQTDRKRIIVQGDSTEQITEFYKNIRSELN